MKPVYRIAFALSMALTITALVLTLSWGLRLGVDFRGGSVVELTFASRPALDDISKTLTGLSDTTLREASAAVAGDAGVVLRARELTETQHQTLLTALEKAFPKAGMKELRFDSVGPAVGTELRTKSMQAILIVLIAIGLYIAMVFRTMRRTLDWWVMSLATMVALAHDVLLPIGVFAVLGHYLNVEIGAVFVAAILTIMGYSISDTVVVFDRVRENVNRGLLTKDTSFGEVVHRSIMQTLVRSINTNVTTMLSLVAIYLFGGESIRYFALALIVGIFSGAYSSIFIASPLLVWLSRRSRRA